MGDWLQTIIVAIIASLPGLVALYQNRKKNIAETVKLRAETEKAKAETNFIHAQVADRWAEHVGELDGKITRLEEEREKDKDEIRGLRIDVNQVQRENEEYRRENTALKDWAERLVKQLFRHVPDVLPEEFFKRSSNI